jgi:hypothetical protein
MRGPPPKPNLIFSFPRKSIGPASGFPVWCAAAAKIDRKNPALRLALRTSKNTGQQIAVSVFQTLFYS